MAKAFCIMLSQLVKKGYNGDKKLQLYGRDYNVNACVRYDGAKCERQKVTLSALNFCSK